MLRSPSRALLLALAASLTLAACGDGDGAEGGDDDLADAVVDVADRDGDVAVVGLDTLEWDTESLEAEAGEITVELTCEDAVNHNFVIDETDEAVAECAPGETVEGTVELDAGEYTYVCTVPGHESRMRGTLTVG